MTRSTRPDSHPDDTGIVGVLLRASRVEVALAWAALYWAGTLWSGSQPGWWNGAAWILGTVAVLLAQALHTILLHQLGTEPATTDGARDRKR